MMRNKYEDILDNFELYYPNIHAQAIDWWASGRMSITVRLRNGNVYEYDRLDNSLRRVRNDIVSADDETVAKEFGYNLQKFIRLSGMTQTEIAEKLGITNAMLSRYTHGTSMPNANKAYRIAKLLGCTIDELFDGTYME